MKIKLLQFAATVLASTLFALPCLARDSFSRPYEATHGGYAGSDDFDKTMERAEENGMERKKTGVIFHRRDKRPAAEQFEEAGKKYLSGNLKGACRAFDCLVRSCPFSAEASRAQYNVGAILERRGKYDRAFDEYRYLLQYYPESAKADVVLAHMFAIANWQLGRKRRSAAVKSFAAIAALAPGWEKSPEALFLMGNAYASMREWYDAADAYDTVSSDYPASNFALPAMVRHADVLHSLSRKYPEDAAIRSRAITVATSAIAALPSDSPARAGVVAILEDLIDKRDAHAFATARFYDSKRHKPESAISAYEEFLRQYPQSQQAEAARSRLAELREQTGADNP